VYYNDSKQATTPMNYSVAFTNLLASSNAYGYLGYTLLPTYSTEQCAAKCSAIVDCASFNLYYERDPSLGPGPSCTNPPSTVNIKCPFWGGPISNSNTVVNNGQMRYDFKVAIADSNGYVSTSIQTTPGYSDGIYLGNSAIYATNACNGDSKLLYSKLFSTPAFDTTLCSAACDTSDGNLADPPEMVRSQQIDGGWGCMLLVRYRLRISGKCHRSGAGSVADQYIRMLSYPPE
jgi:hypothetical protein